MEETVRVTKAELTELGEVCGNIGKVSEHYRSKDGEAPCDVLRARGVDRQVKLLWEKCRRSRDVSDGGIMCQLNSNQN